MNIRKDIQIAWNLLSIVEHEPEKTQYYLRRLRQEFHMKLSYDALKHIIGPLYKAQLINSRPGLGIWRMSDITIIYLSEVYAALDYNISWATGPLQELQKKIYRLIEDTYIRYGIK